MCLRSEKPVDSANVGKGNGGVEGECHGCHRHLFSNPMNSTSLEPLLLLYYCCHYFHLTFLWLLLLVNAIVPAEIRIFHSLDCLFLLGQDFMYPMIFHQFFVLSKEFVFFFFFDGNDFGFLDQRVMMNGVGQSGL